MTALVTMYAPRNALYWPTHAEKSALSFLCLAYNFNRTLGFSAERVIAVASSGIPGLLGF